MARRKKAHNRKEGVNRTQSGRLSRSKEAKQQRIEMTEKEALEVGIKQRVKAGIPEDRARDQKYGTVQGQLYNSGQLSQSQFEAAEWFLLIRNNYLCAIDSPGAVWDRDDTKSPSYDPDAHANFCNAARERWGQVFNAINELRYTNEGNFSGALDCLLIRQRLQYTLVGDLRIALNAIHKVRVGDSKKKAPSIDARKE